jgi:hypothetical protein
MKRWRIRSIPWVIAEFHNPSDARQKMERHMIRVIILVVLSLPLAVAPWDILWRETPAIALADDDDDGGDDDGGDDGGGDDGGGGDGGGRDGGGGGSDDNDGDDNDGDRDSDDDRDDGRGDRDNDDDDREDDDDGDDDDDDEDDDDEDDEEAEDDRLGVADQFLDDLRALISGDDDSSRERFVAQEIIGIDLDGSALEALLADGFFSLETRTLGALGTTLHRLSVPRRLSEAAGLAQARRIAPDAEFDFNHLYLGGGTPCTGAACWPVETVAFTPLVGDACARGAPIAILDTAVDVAHPALRGARIEGRSFLSDDLRAAPSTHGTAVAALLVGRVAPDVAPLAPGATLLAAEVFAVRGDDDIADAAAIVAALDWAIASRARVIGMSLEGAPNALIARGVRAAARRANLLAAAGNGGGSAAPAHPAALPEVIAVAAVDARRRAWRGGNRGDYVELAAPGVQVVSAGDGGGVTAWTGTSFAVPFAVAATLRARAVTGGDPQAARRLLTQQARDLGAPGRDPLFGYGLVSAPGGRCW